MSSICKVNIPAYKGERDTNQIENFLFIARTNIIAPLADIALEKASIIEDPEEKARYAATQESNAVEKAASFMRDDALTWWVSLLKDNAQPRTWPAFEEVFRAHHCPVNAEMKARDDLWSCRQGKGSVTEYVNKFISFQLAIRPPMADTEKADHFLHGLAAEPKFQVVKSMVKSFEDMMRVALATGDAMEFARPARQQDVGRGQAGEAMDLGTVSAAPNRAVRPRKPTFDEMSRRVNTRFSKSCWRCGQPGHVKQECTAPVQRTLQGNAARALAQPSR